MTDADFRLEQSTNLEDWSPADGTRTVEDEGVVDRVSIIVPFNGRDDAAYFRLVVDLR